MAGSKIVIKSDPLGLQNSITSTRKNKKRIESTDMNTLYLLYGVLLVVIFIAVIIHSYNPKRKNDIETPKYRMLNDDD